MNERLARELKFESVPDLEIDLARLSAEETIRAYLQERTHLLRFKYLDKLARYGVSTAVGWAIFRLSDQEEFDESGAMTIAADKEVLVFYAPLLNARTVDSHPIPNIRVITNEPYRYPGRPNQYLSRDFTLDHEDDVQYFVDAQDVYDFSDESKAMPISEENPQGRTDTSTSLFEVGEDGKLDTSKPISIFTESKSINLANPGGNAMVECYPLGVYTSPYDSIYALEQGEELFSAIEFLDPVCIS